MGDFWWSQYKCGGLDFGGLDVCLCDFRGVRKPDRTGIGGNGTEKGVVDGKESLLLVAPFGACQTFEDFEVRGKFEGYCGNVGTEG